MKIVHIIRRFSFQEWGGTESVVWNSACASKKEGHDVEIIATQALSPTPFERVNGITIRRFNYIYPYFPMTKERRLELDKKGGNPYVFNLYHYLIKNKFDIYHVHTMGRIAQCVRKVAEKRVKPLVISFHGGCFDIPETERQQLVKPIKGLFPYGGILDRLFGYRTDPIQKATGIICVGKHEQLLAQQRYPHQHVLYLPNGVNETFLAQDISVNLFEKYPSLKDKKIALCVSRIDYQKNQIALVDLLKKMKTYDPSWHLLLIGPVTAEWYYQKIKEQIISQQLDSSVTCIEGLPHDSPYLKAAYCAAELFLLPSIHEPFGIVLLEAMAMKKPIFAAKVGGIPYFITDQENGFFADFTQSEKVAADINHVLQDKDQLKKVIEQAYEDVKSNYTWDVINARLIAFYESLSATLK